MFRPAATNPCIYIPVATQKDRRVKDFPHIPPLHIRETWTCFSRFGDLSMCVFDDVPLPSPKTLRPPPANPPSPPLSLAYRAASNKWLGRSEMGKLSFPGKPDGTTCFGLEHHAGKTTLYRETLKESWKIWKWMAPPVLSSEYVLLPRGPCSELP